MSVGIRAGPSHPSATSVLVARGGQGSAGAGASMEGRSANSGGRYRSISTDQGRWGGGGGEGGAVGKRRRQAPQHQHRPGRGGERGRRDPAGAPPLEREEQAHGH